MISFHDLKINPNGETGFFLPMRLRIMLTNELNKQSVNVNRKLISYREIMNSKELAAKYKPYQEKAYQAFVANGCDEAMQPQFYDMLITDIEPNYLFEKLKLFYGDTIDPDYAFWKQVNSHPKTVKDEIKETERITIPVSSDKFEIIGSYEEIQDLAQLMKEKDLTEQDCETVLRAIRLPIFPTI